MRLIFFGTADFAVPSLAKLKSSGFEISCVVTAQARPKGRGLKVMPSPIKIKAQEIGLEVYEPENPNSREFYELLAKKNPEVCVLVAYGYIIKPPLLFLPKKGFVNLHPSLLPRYRGAAPINWAIMRGEKETGLTTFLMNEKIDAGGIIRQKKVGIEPEATAGELSQKLALIGAELLVETLQLINQGDYSTIPQDDSAISLAPKIKNSDRVIIWARSSLEIHNQIRGLSPEPACYTFFRGKRVEIYRSNLKSVWNGQSSNKYEPGTILVPNKDLIVATGSGVLMINQLKIEGGKLITGRDFINGQRVKVFEKFTDSSNSNQ